jgi:hypothetical protein
MTEQSRETPAPSTPRQLVVQLQKHIPETYEASPGRNFAISCARDIATTGNLSATSEAQAELHPDIMSDFQNTLAALKEKGMDDTQIRAFFDEAETMLDEQ